MKISVKDIILDTDPRIRTKSEQVPLPLSAEDSELLEAMMLMCAIRRTRRSPSVKACAPPWASPPSSSASPRR